MRIMEVSIEKIKEVKEYLKSINGLDIHDIVFTKNGKPIEINKKILDDFRFTGLNNVDIITTNFYKHGFVKSK